MLKQTPEYLIKTYNNTPEKVSVLASDYSTLWINNSFLNLLKNCCKNSSDINTEMSFFDLLQKYLQEDLFIVSHIKMEFAKLLEDTDKCFTYEFPVFSAEKPIWLMMVACSVYDKESDEKFIVTKMYDVTLHHNRRKLENKWDDNNIVRQIIGESMHTWRQPLNTISLFVQDIKEQFDDSTLTKYYMNFASVKISNEIQRLSESIDIMSDFYTNETNEDLINLSESLFKTLEKIKKILAKNNIYVSVECHALDNLPTEEFISISNHFKIRCGTGTKKCLYGCHKGNIVIYGDNVIYNYIIKMLITLGIQMDSESSIEKNVMVNLRKENDQLVMHFKYDFRNSGASDIFGFIKDLFEKNFRGKAQIVDNENPEFILYIDEYKTKNPI